MPANVTRPDCGRYTPDSTLKIEVLPAPFGPMIANSSLPPTVNDTPSMAFTPANDNATSVELQHRRLDLGPGGGPLGGCGHDSHLLRRL